MSLFLLLFLLLTKHFVVDFLLQPPYMWMNKGTFGHPGGLLHSGLHVLVSGVIFFLFFLSGAPLSEIPSLFQTDSGRELLQGVGLLVGTIMVFEFVCHYTIDFAKMNINKYFGWKAESSEKFWYLMGLDQYLHYLTYFAIFYALTSFIDGMNH